MLHVRGLLAVIDREIASSRAAKGPLAQPALPSPFSNGLTRFTRLHPTKIKARAKANAVLLADTAGATVGRDNVPC